MSKAYSRNFYTNPFRYRSFNIKIDRAEVLEDVEYTIEPFLNEKFPLIKDYIDEFGDFKSEAKIIRLIKEKLIFLESDTKIIRLIRFIKEQLNTIAKSYNFSLNNLESYNTNLRYLELPVHPMVDRNGFEVQSLSQQILDNAIDDIEDGFTYIYDYCSKILPETIELWEDELEYNADFAPEEYPLFTYYEMLDSAYETFEEFFVNFSKNPKDLIKLVITGDANTNILTIIKPPLPIKLEMRDYGVMLAKFFAGIRVIKVNPEVDLVHYFYMFLPRLISSLILLHTIRKFLKSYFVSKIIKSTKSGIIGFYTAMVYIYENTDLRIDELKEKLKTEETLHAIKEFLNDEEPYRKTIRYIIKEQNNKIKLKLFRLKLKVLNFRFSWKYEVVKFITRKEELLEKFTVINQ